MSSRFLIPGALLLALGCAPGEDPGASTQGLGVPTPQCSVSGMGTLPSGDFAAGDILGGDGPATGSWLHVSPTAGVVLATPDWILCRINGSTLADFAGDATVDGASGYTYRVSIQDRGVPGPPVVTPGVPTVETLTATRYNRPTRFDDGELVIAEDQARVTIPAELPVVSGAPGTGMAVLSFTRADTGDTIACRYYGNGSRSRGGDRYELRHCVGLHGLPETVAGDVVDVTAMTLRVQSGDSHSRGCSAETTVSVNLDVTPLTVEEPVRDYYRIAVFAPDGTDFLGADGNLAAGDFTVVHL